MIAPRPRATTIAYGCSGYLALVRASLAAPPLPLSLEAVTAGRGGSIGESMSETSKWPHDHKEKHAAAARLGWERRRGHLHRPTKRNEARKERSLSKTQGFIRAIRTPEVYDAEGRGYVRHANGGGMVLVYTPPGVKPAPYSALRSRRH